MNVEHYSYTPHPKDFSLPIPRFACAFWVMRFTRFFWPLRSCYQALPFVTMRVHVMARSVRLVWILPPAAYQLLPNITMGLIWFGPAREDTLPGPTSGRHTHDIQGNELELIVGGTVDKSDVVLAFIG